MLQVFNLDVGKLDRDVAYIYIYAIVSGVFIHMLQVFHLDVCIFFLRLPFCNGYTRVFMFFFGVLRVFHMYVASVPAVLNVCCKCFTSIL
jgi:hypothetical protein